MYKSNNTYKDKLFNQLFIIFYCLNLSYYFYSLNSLNINYHLILLIKIN